MADPENPVPTETTSHDTLGPDNGVTETVVVEKSRRSWGVRVAKIIAAIVIGLVLLVLAIVLGLNTSPGRRFVADQIAALEFANGMKIRVGRIDGSLYGKMTLRQLSVRDPKGEFLFSPEVVVDWRPFEYISNHVDVRSATAERMILRRTPQFNATPPADPNEPLLPDIDIDVGRLKVTSFVIEKPVTGERRVATIDGRTHISDGRAQIDATGGLIAARGVPGGDRFKIKLDAVPADNKLDIDMDLNAPRGGVIASLGGFTQPLAITVNGKGTWANWNGQLGANLGAGELARLAVTARDGTFTLRGPTQIAKLVTGPTANLLGPITNLDVTAALANRQAKVSGRIWSDAFNLTPDGTISLADNSFKDFKVAFELLKPSALAENLSGAGLNARATLNGAFATPGVQYAINATRIVMNDMGLEGFTASGAATVNAERILIPVKASVRRITGLDTVAGGTLTNVQLGGDLAIDGPRILSDNMRIRSDRIDAKLILLADMSKGIYTGAVDGRIDGYRLESVGIFTIDTNIDLKAKADGYALEGTVRARSTRLLNESLKTYLGGNFVASTRVSYGSDGMARFTGLRLEAPDLRVAGGTGAYSTANGRLVLNAKGTSRRYGNIGVRVDGTMQDPNAHITAERPDFGVGLANVDAKINGVRGGYNLALSSDSDYGPITADVNLEMGRQLAVQVNSANLSGVNFAGRIVQTSAGPFAGQLTANGNGLGGLVRLDGVGKYQAATFNVRAQDTVFRGPANLSIGSAIIDGRAVLYDQPMIVADAQIAGTQFGSLNIAAARVLVDYQNGRGSAKALVEGTSGVPFRISANADLKPELWRVALAGRVRGLDIKTVTPARIVPKNGVYSLLPTTVNFGGGNVQLAGSYGGGMKLQSRLEKVDLALVNAFMPGLGIGGSASGSLDFEQSSPTAFPRADARLHLDNFSRTTAASVSQPIDINFVGKLLPDGAQANAIMRRRGSVIGRLTTTLKPLGSSGTWMERLMSAQLGGGIRYNGPADTLFSFAGMTDQRLTGPVGLAADFSCRVQAPCLNGVVRGQNLVYENLTYGTKLTQMNLSGRFDGGGLELESMTAKAGDGSISASGTLSLSAEQGYPMDLAVDLTQARLAESNALAATATGKLRLTKVGNQAPLLSGEIRLPETRYQIVREGAAQVPRLTGVRFKPPKGPQRITGNEPVQASGGGFAAIRLDLKLIAPEKLYISGMGLESEWKANLGIAGTSSEPSLSGEVELIRGTLGFAGKSFDITEGLVSFTGGKSLEPTVRIVASDDVEDVTVSVNVTGRAYNPEIAFSSTPSLPQDEVLSRILFGSSIANLSAIQAVQLASSLNSLRGSGGGLNPLGSLRQAAGIDRLRVLGADEASGRGTALAAGQYLTDDIYVELITDARGFTATQLEISINKWLSMLSQAGGSGVNSVSARVKKNY